MGEHSIRKARTELLEERKFPQGYSRRYQLSISREIRERSYAVDEDGFLQGPKCWNQEVAMVLASTEAIGELTHEQRKVIRYIRNYYLEFGTPPMICSLCKETGYGVNEIYKLFPSGYLTLAGLLARLLDNTTMEKPEQSFALADDRCASS